MGSKKKRRAPHAFLIIALLIGAIVAGAYTYFQYIRPVQTVECGEETPGATAPKISTAYQTTIRGITYNAVNTTFSSAAQQVAIGSPSSVTFVSNLFFDPSKPHLVGGQCVTDPLSPITLRLRTTFSIDGNTETLLLQYGGNPPALLQGCNCNFNEAFSTHTGPIAGVRWYLGDTHVILLVSLS